MPRSAAAAFVQNPCNPLFADPLYRTGDYAVISGDGELFFRGRRDNQVKYQGHRIELEEIDKAAESVAGVTMCRSVFDAARERLYAFYVGDIDKRELIGAMRGSLPKFMVPSRVTRMRSMPLTKNGKADRKALLAMARASGHGAGDGRRHDG
jgi:acyl-coenzyme A synthetase/AMP-(fatty) acid ligase